VRHPPEATLALYAGGDLGLWARLGVARHVRQCDRCGRLVEEFRGVSEFLEEQRDELPRGVEWDEAAAAMKANIRLGIAAGQCVASPPPERVRVAWRTPALALPVLLVILAGWILQSLPPAVHVSLTPESRGSAMVLDADAAGIGLERDGRGFRLLRPDAAQNVEVSVRGDSVRSRYVDGETGQVTISHVYAE
jgi:hypothetical protein